MKKIIRFTGFCLAIALLSPACKKYEEGPGISLLTKKARMAGNWKMASYREESSTTSGDPSTTYTTVTESSDGSSLSETKTSTASGSSPMVRTGTITQSLTMEKKGEYLLKKTTVLTKVETSSVGTTTIETTKKETIISETKGVWNFAGGVGEVKNKQNVLFSTTGSTTVTTNQQTTVTTTPSGTTTATSTNESTSTDSYSGLPQVIEMEIVKLKNKELKLRYNAKTSSTTTTSTTTSTGEQLDKYIVNYEQ